MPVQAASPVVVRTKLAPPRLSGSVQRRGELVDSLVDQCDKRLTVVTGPAGCGKTTLLALFRQALVTTGHAVCWCNTSADDSEPVQFATYLVAALQTLHPGIGESALAVYEPGQGRAADGFVATLVNELVDLETPLHLFIEDVHLLADTEGGTILGRLIEQAPATLRLVVSSRVRPPFDCLRLRVTDELNELSFADLRFSLRESVEFLRGQGLHTLGPSRLHQIHTLADGWAAGLQILAYSARRSRNPVQFLERFSGPLTPDKAASLTDYLSQYVGPLLSAREFDFLIKVSACRRFDAELCVVVTGDPQAREMLQRFVDDNLFVMPIDFDDDRQWFRLHNIFAKFLHSHLVRLDPQELVQINRAASQWFGARGHAAEAVRHALFAGDHQACVDQIERVGRSMVGSWQSHQLLRWLDQLRPDVVASRTELLLLSAWANCSCGRLPEMERAMALIQALPVAPEPMVAFEIRLLQANRMLVKDDARQVLQLMEPDHVEPPKASRFLLYLMHCQSALALLQLRDFDRMHEHVCRCRALYTRGEVATPLLDALVGAALLRQGQPREARRVLLRAIELAEQDPRMGRESLAALAAYLAETLQCLGDAPAAAALLGQYAALIDTISSPDPALAAQRARIRWHACEGDLEAALDVARGLEERGQVAGLARMTAWGLAEQVRLQVRAGQLPAAQASWRRLSRWMEDQPPALRAARPELDTALQLSRLRLQVGEQQWVVAADLGRTLLAAAVDGHHPLLATTLRLILADVHLQGGDVDACAALLEQVLAEAALYGLDGLLHEELTRATAQFLASKMHLPAWRAAIQGVTPGSSGRLGQDAAGEPPGRPSSLQAGAPASRAARPAQAVDGGARLSAKELEVVDLLSKALSNKSIAKALNISPGTVKWHLKSIYAKLGAVSREDAGIKARSLQIVR